MVKKTPIANIVNFFEIFNVSLRLAFFFFYYSFFVYIYLAII